MISNKSKGKGSIFQKVPSIFSFRKYTLQWGIVLVLVVVIILFIIGSPKAFLSPRLYLAIMATAPFVGIMALGMTFMVISGEIDLSFGSVMGMSGLIFAIIYTVTGSAALASVGALSMGLVAGALNGVLVTKIGIPSFVATIAMMFFWRGLTHVGSGGLPIAFTSAVKATAMADVFVGRVGGVIPAQFLWLVLLSVVLWFILNRHSFGNDVYFVGDNKASAKVVGINVDRTKILTPILTLHLGTAVVRFLAGEEEREKRRQAFSAMLWPVLAFSCLVLLISVLLRQSLSIFLFASPQYAIFIPLTFLWSLVETLFQFSLSYLRARGKIKRLSIARIALSAMRVILIVVLAIAGYSLGWIIACLIAIEALFMVAVFGVIIREIGFPKPALGGLKGYLAFSVPQIPSGVLIWIIGASDRYFITHFLNLSQVGIYSASYGLGNLISFFYMPIGFVLLPTVSKFWEGGEAANGKKLL